MDLSISMLKNSVWCEGEKDVANFNPFLRQRRTVAAAFVAATGSFLLGVMLPINVRTSQTTQLIDASPKTNGANPTTHLLAVSSPTNRTPPLPAILKVTQAVNQRVNEAKKTLSQLEETRFQVSVPTRFQGTTITHAQLNSSKKVIALTFDDGPWPETTVQILDILKKNNIKATFFWVGRYLKAYPDLGKKVVEAGHAIGNHTWNHQYVKYSEAAAAKEIDRTTSLIEEVTGIKTSLFRPPGGILTNGLVAYAHQKKYAVMMWSADSFDWRNSKQSLTNNVLRNARPGGIVLMHDGGGNRSKTVEALPTLIAELQKQGYHFVTVPELLQMQEKEMKQRVTAQKPQAKP